MPTSPKPLAGCSQSEAPIRRAAACSASGRGDATGSLTLRVRRGDVDKNGNVNAADITAIKPFLGSGAAANPNADMDCNGAINAADITYVKPRLGTTATACP